MYQPALLPSALPVRVLPHGDRRRPASRAERDAERMPATADRAVARSHQTAAGIALLLLLPLALGPVVITPAFAANSNSAGDMNLTELGWVWPADSFRVVRAYVAPAHEYGPGHRGVDLDLLGQTEVRAPADGVIAFSGSVAGRGILTIDHGDGLVTTLEPVDTPLVPGTAVVRGGDVATLASGGHAPAGALHFGVRLDGEYINPMMLLGGVPRAVLLPCCE